MGEPMPLVARVMPSVGAVSASDWDACACGEQTIGNPFLRHAFLSALEDSGCVGGRSGWIPTPVIVEREGVIVGAATAYLKLHSQGEYVFDHGWADAYERAGGQYYPKLQVSVPFTPATGPRLLVRAGEHGDAIRAALLQTLQKVMAQAKASSLHLTFLAEADRLATERAGFLQRIDQQYHWTNAGYGCFDNFLEALASRKRKVIRRERRDALANGITIEALTGEAITEAHWDSFFAFYMDTGSRKWGRPYLNRAFFSLIGERMADAILLVMAKREKRHIAGAINFIGEDALYGRNWGAIEEHPFLHFEVCYYQAIDFAIARGLKRVEAGAQGEHKLARGYLPVTTHSAHHIPDPGFRRAVERYLEGERQHISAVSAALGEESPFRKG
jgi:uncharacterized protein